MTKDAVRRRFDPDRWTDSPSVNLPPTEYHRSSASRTFLVKSTKPNGFAIKETLLSNLPAWIVGSPVYPVVSTTFSAGRRRRASSES
jgi:hypothetical protein